MDEYWNMEYINGFLIDKVGLRRNPEVGSLHSPKSDQSGGCQYQNSVNKHFLAHILLPQNPLRNLMNFFQVIQFSYC